jgi:hypothetical protein
MSVASHEDAAPPPRVLGRPRVVWFQVAVAVGLAGIVVAWLAQPVIGGDTAPLMAGTEALGRCLADLDLVSCNQTTPIGPYPLVQYVPDLLADAGAELSADSRVRVLAILSGLGVAAAIAAAWIVLRRVGCPEWRWGFLLVAVSGPALAYGNTTWGEMLAMGLLTIFVAAALVPTRPAVLGLAAFGAGLTKETGYPFVLALGIISLLLARKRTGGSIRLHVLLGATGVALAFAVSSAFNLIRFGTPRNAYYLDPALRTSTVDWFAELAAGLFVAPNGGIVFFWPLAFVLVALLVSIPAVQALRGTTSWREAWVSLALIGVVTGLVVGLAAWWAPFGWWAWGPRLSLPWVLPILLLALAAFGSMLTPFVARALTSLAGLGVAALVVVVALPHVGLLGRPQTVGEFFFFHKTSVCPGGGPPPTPAYYDCLREEMWSRHPIWLDSLSSLATPKGASTALAVVIVIVGCLVLLRREVVGRAEPAESVRGLVDGSEASRIVSTA